MLQCQHLPVNLSGESGAETVMTGGREEPRHDQDCLIIHISHFPFKPALKLGPEVFLWRKKALLDFFAPLPSVATLNKFPLLAFLLLVI